MRKLLLSFLFIIILSISVNAVIFANYPEKLTNTVKKLRNSTDNTPPIISTTQIPNYIFANSTFIFQINAKDLDSGLYSLEGHIINLNDASSNKIDLFNDGSHNDGSSGDSIYSSVLETGKLNPKNNVILLTAIDNAGNKATLTKTIKDIIYPKKCDNLVYNGDPNNKLDIVFLGDNFLNLEELGNITKLHYENIFGFEPLKTALAQNKINLYLINDTVDLYCNYGVSIGANLTPQPHWLGCDNEKVLLTISNCPNDAAMVIVNNETYGGTAWGSYAIVYKNGHNTNTPAHEFGHVFGKLHDEYSYGINASPKWTAQGANCDTEQTCTKWSKIINTNCFTGCSYDNWFRPIINQTLMYDAKGDFGSVNQAELNKRLSSYS